MALVNKGVALSQLGRREDAIATCDEVDRRYSTDNAPALNEQVAEALVNKGGWLSDLGRTAEAIAVFNEIERRFGADEHPAVRAVVDRAREQRSRLDGDAHDDDAGPEND